MARARQAIRDIDWLKAQGLTDALFRRYIHRDGKSMKGFRSYCENNPNIEFEAANSGNCDRLGYSVKYWNDGPVEEVLQAGLRRFPK